MLIIDAFLGRERKRETKNEGRSGGEAEERR